MIQSAESLQIPEYANDINSNHIYLVNADGEIPIRRFKDSYILIDSLTARGETSNNLMTNLFEEN